MTNWLGGEDGLLSLVVIWWAALATWRVATVTTSRRVWWALAAFALSATLYVGPVARFAASVVGSSRPCDQFENLWGVGVSGLILLVLCAWTNRVLAAVVVSATVSAAVVLVALAAATSPSPVGCVSTLDLPWWSPYWWIIIAAHSGAALTAAVVCGVDAVVIARHDRVAGVAVGGVAIGFVMSATYWLLNWTALLTGGSSVASWGSANVFPATVLCMTACTVVAAIDAVVTTLRHRDAIAATWREYRVAFASAHPGAEVPTRWAVVGPWWSHPAQCLHQLRIQVCDLTLIRHEFTSTTATTTEAVHDGAGS